MKKIFSPGKLGFNFIISILFFFVSCETSKKWIAPPFTSIDKIINLKPGMSFSQASLILGIEPYDVYHMSDDAGNVYVFYYRVKDRRMTVPLDPAQKEIAVHSESGQKDGELWYKDKAYRLYILFKDDKLKSLISDAGRDDSEYILLLNNNIQFLTKEAYSTFVKDIISKEQTLKDGYLINKNFEQPMPLKLKFPKPDSASDTKSALPLPAAKKKK